MPVTTILAHGLRTGAGTGNKQPPPARTQCTGWSYHATTRNTRWLQTVDAESLTGQGIALTLTIRDTPDTPQEWAKLRNAFMHRMKRMGLIRCHWVTEWQRRKVPHLHMAVWFPDGADGNELEAKLLQHWLDLTASYGTASRGQHAAPIHGPIGWFKYTSKHAARGAKHYQRHPDARPDNWQSSGRVWGHTGLWTTIEPTQVDHTWQSFHKLRRLVRAWLKADAAKNHLGRIGITRRMLKCNDPKLSRCRGISQWIPEHVSAQMILCLMTEHTFNLRVPEETSAPTTTTTEEHKTPTETA